jgi:hypothetical protein bfra3_11911
MNHLSEALRWVFAGIGAIIAILEPTLPYLIICTLMIFADCYTAWQLSKRARKAHPERVSKDGKKFKSQHFGKVIVTILKAWALIIMAFLMQTYITDDLPVDLTKVAAGAICFWQLLSVLENESSCNGAKWAKLLQNILVDKTERHFDIDLSEIKQGHEQYEHN